MEGTEFEERVGKLDSQDKDYYTVCNLNIAE
jgi:hypothetical protein